jgi:DNA uptake protein ComE-like DNA-binding protein
LNANQMKVLSLENPSVQTPSAQLARLSGPHGYRLDGDLVHLNAMFALLDPAAHARSWALQLWACPVAPASARDLAGHIVAEVSLPPMGEIADEIEHFEVTAFACPPAGPGDHAMVLVLASGRPGQFNDVHDLAVYPARQEFVQPRLNGTVGYRIDGGRVQISVGSVENPRPDDKRSGSLSLELWALPARFDGGNFNGHHLAGVEIGALNGQSEIVLAPVDLAFTAPPAGEWQIVLMLREWTAAGFVTRDFTNFAVSFISAPVVEKAPAPVVEKPAAAAAAKTLPPVAVKAPAPEAAKSAPPVAAKAPAPVAAKVVVPVSPAAAKSPVDASPKRVSVNTARVEELAAVEGISRKLAEGIVKKRPFASLDDLRKVKGLGVKILASIRSSLKV